MINPDKSGVMCTMNPLDGDTSKVLIEASWGLGNTITSGEVSPDCFILDKNTGEVVEKRISKKLWMKKRDAVSGRTIREAVPRDRIQISAVEENELRKLWELGRRVEELFGKPQVVEWCIERNRIFLLQSGHIIYKNTEKQEITQGRGRFYSRDWVSRMVTGKV